ncbi:Hypothetical protein CINCED_3A001330 [Cinara cedri]|uniref:Uncharacterized protein n=1 Tax=Cinara cedri TaxID=506608 RepID=A0A5E4MUP9_9HEMI|nr:Hypothetical protein CINCED_3A001330 [Cinara cedri]
MDFQITSTDLGREVVDLSTVDAINKVMSDVTDSGTGSIKKRELCVLVTLNVDKAFNSTS